MTRIATLTAALCMLVASSAFAAPADFRSPDPHTTGHAAQTHYYAAHGRLASSHANLPSPDVVDSIVPPVASQQPAGSDGNEVSAWAVIGLIAGGLAVFGGLMFAVRRHYRLGPPARA